MPAPVRHIGINDRFGHFGLVAALLKQLWSCAKYIAEVPQNFCNRSVKIHSVYDSEFKPYGKVLDGYDTAAVKAFKVPTGVPVEVFATTLHYAPCHVSEAEGFRVAVVLPRGTNTAAPGAKPMNEEDTWLTARNKWLLAHPDSNEAKKGAHIGLKGVNIDIAADI